MVGKTASPGHRAKKSLNILLVHNRYQRPGGEDAVMVGEKDLLMAGGHRVREYTRNNNEILQYGFWSKLTLAPRTVWGWDSYSEIKALVQQDRPDVVHFHNTFPLISPAAYYACSSANIPVVQTLHNYRLFCPAASFARDGRVCEECVEHTLWRSVRYACYRNSRPATATSALALAVHRMVGTWEQVVDCYISLTEFARNKLSEAGLPAGKIVVKPNFVHPDPLARTSTGNYAIFVGRLSEVKGIRTLLRVWRSRLQHIPLVVVGDGPLRASLENQPGGRTEKDIHFRGQLPRGNTLDVMKGARFVVFPSESYEGFPMTIAEAYACGLPVIASRLGSMAEIVEDGRTGLLFTPGDPADLAAKVDWAWAHTRAMEEMGRNARALYEQRYTAERNYKALMEIYRRVVDGRSD